MSTKLRYGDLLYLACLSLPHTYDKTLQVKDVRPNMQEGKRDKITGNEHSVKPLPLKGSILPRARFTGGHGLGGVCGHIKAFAFPRQTKISTKGCQGQHASGENTTEAKTLSIIILFNATRYYTQ